MGIGFRRSPALAVLSPLSLALLSLTRDERLSRLLTVAPRSESIERFATCAPFTAFLRWSGEVGDEELLFECECECEGDGDAFFAFLDGERVKRGSHECECVSASEPSVDVDQRERSVRSGSAPIESVEGERRTGAGLSAEGESLTKVTSMSKSNEDMGDAGADDSVSCE